LNKLTFDLDLRVYHDGYKERIEAMVTSKMKGEVAQVKRRSREACGQEPDGDAQRNG
jgi:hypothetical protein